MISANIDNKTRRHVYERDGFRCALCDSTKYIQIHHVTKRSAGGGGDVMNLITLCSDCHGAAHNSRWADEVEQAAVEYIGDLYAARWPWKVQD